jgi:hypothetical protein
MSSASRPKVSCLIRASSAFRVMLRIAVTSPVRSLPALPAHRQHPGATRFVWLPRPAVRTSMANFGVAYAQSLRRPARSEWNPFAALQRYAGCRAKTGNVWCKLEMTCMTPAVVALDRHPGRSAISSQRKAIDRGAPYGRTAR